LPQHASSDTSLSLAATTATLISLHAAAAEGQEVSPTAHAIRGAGGVVVGTGSPTSAAASTAAHHLARYSVFHSPKVAAVVLSVLRGRLFAGDTSPTRETATVDLASPVVAAAGVARAVCGAVIRTACQHANLPAADAPPTHFDDAAEMLAIAMQQWPVTTDDKEAAAELLIRTVPYRSLRQRWAAATAAGCQAIPAGPLTHPLPLTSWDDWLRGMGRATVGPHTAPLPRHLFGPLAFAAPWKTATGRRPITRSSQATSATPPAPTHTPSSPLR